MILLLVFGLFALYMAATSFVRIGRIRKSVEYEPTTSLEENRESVEQGVRKLKVQGVVFLFLGAGCAVTFLIIKNMVVDL